MKQKEILTAAIVAVFIIIAVVLVLRPRSTGSNYDSLAQCLTEKGAAMYGAYWCPHCKTQKEMFGNSFKYINYIECDARGENAKPELCEQAGITGYPTWIINGKTYVGVRQFQELADATGCSVK